MRVTRQRGGRTAWAAAVLAVGLGGTLGFGCVERASSPAPPGEPLRLQWMEPAPGDSVAGSVRLLVGTRGDATDLAETRFRVNGESLATAEAPPWEALWAVSAPPEGATAHLEATARDSAGTILAECAASLWVMADDPPRLSVVLPATGLWIEQREGAEIVAAAWDAEGREITSSTLRWTGDALPRPLRGARLPLALLPPLLQRLTIEASDRHGRRGEIHLRVRPFRYSDAGDPEALFDNLAAAFGTRDAATWIDQLHERFEFVPCASEADRAGWDPVWPRDTFAARLAVWFTSWPAGEPEWTCTPARVQTWEMDGADHAWLLCSPVRFAVPSAIRVSSRLADPTVSCSIPPDSSGGAGGGAALVLLRREAGGRWKVRLWRDHPDEGVPGLAAAMATAVGLRSPGPGPGCALGSSETSARHGRARSFDPSVSISTPDRAAPPP